jgi:uncharacterized phage protein gp47/JayE
MPSAFQLKTKPEIYRQMEATGRAQLDPEIDLLVGAILRAIYEAASLSDAEQYVMIGKILDLFDRFKTKGEDLDRRALDFGATVFTEMRRRAAQTSIVELLIGDGTTQRSAILTDNVDATETSFVIDDATSWPTSGALVLERGTLREETVIYTRSSTTITVISPATGVVNPHVINGTVETVATKSTTAGAISVGAGSFNLTAGTEGAWPASGTVIFERDTVRREARTFTRVGVAMTLGAITTFAHAISTDVTLSTFGSDRPVSAGTQCFVPESATTQRVLFRTTEAGMLMDGDYVTSLVDGESEAAGAQTRIGSGTITQWSSEPFANATVTNPNAAVRGRDREDDNSYNARISAFIQSLSRATALAIETAVAGQQDPFSSLIIAFAQTVEPVAPGEAQLYITDGSTTFSIDYQVYEGRDVLIADARLNDQRARLNSYGPFLMQASPVDARTPRLYVSGERGTGDLVGANFIEDSTKAWVVNAYTGMHVKTDDNQFYEILSNTAIRLTLDAGGVTPSLGSYAIIDFSADPLEPGVDYVFNQSNGDLELTTALAAHDALVAADDGALANVGAYTYSRGLAAYAQRLVNGDRTDLEAFPGIKALGTQCRVIAPTIVTQTIQIQVITQSGYADTDLISTVQSVVQAYVNGLGIGQQVLLSEIIRLVKGLVGVFDCKVISPNANIVVSDGQIVRINADDVQVV